MIIHTLAVFTSDAVCQRKTCYTAQSHCSA